MNGVTSTAPILPGAADDQRSQAPTAHDTLAAVIRFGFDELSSQRVQIGLHLVMAVVSSRSRGSGGDSVCDDMSGQWWSVAQPLGHHRSS